jgi:hypothetical protein
MPFRKLICAHGKDGTYSCYDKDALLRMRDIWNKRHPKNNITTTNDCRTIWREIKNKIGEQCDHELCWLSKTFKELKLDSSSYFAPFHPKSWKQNEHTWLTSSDISRIMKQYENKFSEYSFIGPSPIDYDTIEYEDTCVWDDLCHFDLRDYLGKKKYIGIIFNTDKHTEQGQHWISLFIDIPKKSIYFFDSAGTIPPPQVERFMSKVRNDAKEINMHVDIYINQVQHQMANGECGMYSLYFIISLLQQDHDFEYFQNHRVPDEEMTRYRLKYYNDPT